MHSCICLSYLTSEEVGPAPTCFLLELNVFRQQLRPPKTSLSSYSVFKVKTCSSVWKDKHATLDKQLDASTNVFLRTTKKFPGYKRQLLCESVAFNALLTMKWATVIADMRHAFCAGTESFTGGSEADLGRQPTVSSHTQSKNGNGSDKPRCKTDIYCAVFVGISPQIVLSLSQSHKNPANSRTCSLLSQSFCFSPSRGRVFGELVMLRDCNLVSYWRVTSSPPQESPSITYSDFPWSRTHERQRDVAVFWGFREAAEGRLPAQLVLDDCDSPWWTRITLWNFAELLPNVVTSWEMQTWIVSLTKPSFGSFLPKKKKRTYTCSN